MYSTVSSPYFYSCSCKTVLINISCLYIFVYFLYGKVMTQHAVAASVSAWHDKTEASVSPVHSML